MSFSKHLALSLVLLALLGTPPAFALDEIYSPNAEYREISLGYTGSDTLDPQAEKNNQQTHQLSLEAGVTPRWTVETSTSFANTPDSSVQLQTAELENRFQFFEQGENWVDSGILLAYAFSTQSQQADSLEAKLLLQKDIGSITSTANIGFTQDVGRYAASGGPAYVFLSNTRYRYNEYLQPGIEIQSDLGQAHTLGHFDQQAHYVGAALYGKVLGALKYQAGYFLGVSDAAAQSAARVLLEYEMHF